jgi:hypothetical protein
MPEDRLAESIREFYAVLVSTRWTGVSRIAELSQLKVLIGRYPHQARRILAELPGP